MDKTIRILAVVANILVFGVFLFALTEMRLWRMPDQLVLLGLFLVPLFNLLALLCGPDRETRQLRRAVEKARLKKALEDLNAGRTPAFEAEKGCCGGH